MAAFHGYLLYEIVGWLLRIGMIGVVLRRQFSPGASLAWLGIVFLHPYIGLALYLAVGESRLGPRRAARHREIVARFRNPARNAERRAHQTQPNAALSYQPMIAQAEKISGLPVLADNRIEFLADAVQFRERLKADIAAATKSVHLLYYIFACDATACDIADAVIEASRRGVKCRVIADAMASRFFFHRDGVAPKLLAGGVEVVGALPVTPIRRRFARMDLRNHRKLAIIDDRIAFNGSHNLINPDYGGRRGNPWVDVTGRFTGPIVGELASVFAEDWEFETGKKIDILYPDADSSAPGADTEGDFPAQVVPTGPTFPDATYRRLLLAAIQSSRQQLILTTPYFVPDEPTMIALMMACDRGVDVKLILPQIPDHLFAAAAGRAHFTTLLKSGVEIHLYQPGLLHSKTTTVDDAFALFGSANLDVRSFGLNFELSTLLYGPQVTERLRNIQRDYLAASRKLELIEWSQRSSAKTYADRAISLLSPLL
jgi:cardiolipin synthase